VFVKGESGNPGGRPKKQFSITAMLRERGEEIVNLETGETRAQRLARIMWEQAEGGDRQMAQYIVDRQDGKPKERVEHSESHVLRVTLDDGSDDDKGTAEAEAVHNQPG
jgi:hypothetical protein